MSLIGQTGKAGRDVTRSSRRLTKKARTRYEGTSVAGFSTIEWMSHRVRSVAPAENDQTGAPPASHTTTVYTIPARYNRPKIILLCLASQRGR